MALAGGSSSSSGSGVPALDPELQRTYGILFRGFIEEEFEHGNYQERIEDMLLRGEDRLIININDLRAFDASSVRALLETPAAFLYVFEEELSKHVHRLAEQERSSSTIGGDPFQKTSLSALDGDEGGSDMQPASAGEAALLAERELAGRTAAGATSGYKHYRVGFEGSFGAHRVSPRSLNATLLSQLVCVEGIVTKVGLVRPKVSTSVHWCEATHEVHVRQYRDLTALIGAPTPSQYQKVDKDNNPLSTEFGHCTYEDHQVVTIQEMPEAAPPGQLPRSVEVILERDLADACKAGDRVRVVGIYRAFPARPKSAKVADGGTDSRTTFRTRILANSVALLNKESVGASVFTDVDVEHIRAIAAESAADDGGGLLERLAGSIAPSIHGHMEIKKAILLVLMGGEEKNLANGTHLRGDMNMLMIGDPSTAKSQLLRFVLHLAPLAISTSGRGSSGVGLTAAVTVDTETGERRLEAGAMVLADRGVVCIDEFDKMSEEDRVAIHEVMEQQTVTIAKAGIHASLNARCSVIAAANPIYGHYNRLKRPTENIGLPDSLLSRFDLLFIVLDTMAPERDRAVAEHVLRMHRYRDRDAATSSADHHLSIAAEQRLDASASLALAGTSAAFHSQAAAEQQHSVYQPHDRLLHAHRKRSEPIFSVGFLKKYILYARHRVHPVLSEDVREFLAQAFADLRSKEQVKTLPITPRTLETMIRISAAAARVRLSNTITRQDAVTALEIMNFSLFHDVHVDAEQSTEEEEEEEQARRDKRSRDDDDDGDGENVEQRKGEAQSKRAAKSSTSSREESFVRAVNAAMRTVNEIDADELLVEINRDNGAPYTSVELRQYLARLEEDGKVMLSENLVLRL